MSEGKKYYCFCSSNCKYETMTKEQIMTAIAQATGVTDVDPDAGFITKVKETNGKCVTFWVGTQENYNRLQTKEENCLYIITDDTSKEDFEKTVADMMGAFDQTRAETAANANAAEEAAAAAEKAAEDAREAVAIDISDSVQFTVGKTMSEVTGVSIAHKCFLYNPAAKRVDFKFNLTYTGALRAGHTLTVEFTTYVPAIMLSVITTRWQVLPYSTAVGFGLHVVDADITEKTLTIAGSYIYEG